MTPAPEPSSENPLEERIRQRAYEIYQQRGEQHGFALDDWIQAENEIWGSNRQLMPESEFWRLVQLLSTEIEDGVTIFHTYEGLNRAILNDEKIALILNEEALFWKVLRYSLQASLFIALGRIFDSAADALSIHKAVNAMIGNPELFSTTALRRRKTSAGFDAGGLDRFIGLAWVPPSSAALRILKKQLSAHSKRFEQIYRPIRDAIFAHRLMSNEEAASALFSDTDRSEISNILDFLHDLIDAIQDLYENGSQPVLGRRRYQEYNQRIRDGVGSVLQKLVNATR